MGQYFIVVNLDKKEYLRPGDFPHSGAKLGEFSHQFCGGFNTLLAQGFGPEGWERDDVLGRWAGDRIVIVGDYDESGLYQEAQTNPSYKNINNLVRLKTSFVLEDGSELPRLRRFSHKYGELSLIQLDFDHTGMGQIVPLLQGWQPQSTRLPAFAQLAWYEGRVWALGTLTDADVFNDATEDNQNTWEMGDVFEVFVRRSDSDAYTEAHVTPNGIRLHLKFPDRATIALARSGQLNGDTLKHDPSEIVAKAWKTEDGWVGLLGVPVDAAPGDKIRVSVCRYDAHRNGEPDVASTSNHAECDFHRPDDWPEYIVPAP